MEVNKKLNHTTAHVLAAAIMQLYPETLLGIGPTIKEGFYYDFKFKNPISDHDLIKIEKRMKKIISTNAQVIFSNDQSYFDFKKQSYKNILANEIIKKGNKLSFYNLVNNQNNQIIFSDLCEGPHIEQIKDIKHFKLLSLAGSYWKGDSKNDQLTRIYGTSWETKDELKKYLEVLEERKARDHRKIGAQMEIFTFDKLSVQGFPIWLENGMIIKNSIQEYIRKIEKEYGFKEVLTPSFGSKKLYEISGHWFHYQEDMFKPIELDNDTIIMRPMTCPHHLLLYNRKRHSYRDLPIKMSEHARLYRYEKSGALTGLERVRSMELTEGHVFLKEDQIADEIKKLYKMIVQVLKKFDIKIKYISLSLRDKNDHEKYFNDDKMWENAQNALKKVLKNLNITYEEKIGEAAFYGPKIDFQVETALGHEITLSTLQLDFLLPQKFNSFYIDKDENKKRPVLIHRGLIGTYERFIAILIEQYKGNFPFWLAPQQIVIIPINLDEHLEYAKMIHQKLNALNFRVEIDKQNERLGKKIRNAQIKKIKYQIVVGDDEVKNQNINIREYGKKATQYISLEQFIKIIKNL